MTFDFELWELMWYKYMQHIYQIHLYGQLAPPPSLLYKIEFVYELDP